MSSDLSSNYEDEIDLRAIALTIWRARKLIIISALIAAVAAFAVSFWILPRQYQATTYVFIGQPAGEFSKSATDSGFTISPTLPDLKAVVKLATSSELLESVLKDPAIAATIGNEEISTSTMMGMVTAVDVGRDQLSLQVTDTNPQRAALLANTLAEKVTDAVNATYGLGALPQALDSQVLHSQKDYNQAQATLEDVISKSQVNALSAQLDSKGSDLVSVLDGISRTKRVLDDLQFFEQGLSGLSGETPLSLGDGLALTTLRQSSLTVASESFTVQIDSASFTGLTVSKALEAATQMRTGLQAQLERLQNDQSRLEQEIPQIAGELENAKAEMDLLTEQRDQFKKLYNDLFEIQNQVTTVLGQSSKVASMSIQAVPPDKKSSPKVVVNTAIFGVLGLMLSVFGVLAVDWWRKE